MAEWVYDPERWAETRQVLIAQDPDGKWRWWRNRTGPDARVVSSCVSGGFDDAKWCYRNAVKENVGLNVPVPDGVEPMTVVDSDTDGDHEDEVETPDVPVTPEVPEEG